jgi:putative ABC transport system permease protein
MESGTSKPFLKLLQTLASVGPFRGFASTKQTPLAWLNLVSSPMRLVLSSGGIGFAVLLMFSQIGFRNGLFDSTVQLARMLDADLMVVSKAKYNLPSEQRFDDRLLARIRAVEGVESCTPVYVERAGTELRVVGKPSRSIRVIGIPLDQQVFEDKKLQTKLSGIRWAGTALLDQYTKSVYGLEMGSRAKLIAQDVELSGKSIRFEDYFELGTDFVHDGSILVTEDSFKRYFPARMNSRGNIQQVDIGLIQLHHPADAKGILQLLQRVAPEEIDFFTKQEVIDRDIRFWGNATPIGIIFTVGTIMGLVVGTIICYQILYTEVFQRLGEFATLKAMGYRSSYFVRLVFLQSLYLSAIGFIPALVVAVAVYRFLRYATGLVMILSWDRIVNVYLLTVLMCVVGGYLALRRLQKIDPADLFT